MLRILLGYSLCNLRDFPACLRLPVQSQMELGLTRVLPIRVGSFFVDELVQFLQFCLKDKNLLRNQFMVLNGIFINAGLLKVTEVEIQPLIPLKFFLAGLCLLFVMWKLYLSLEWTPQGLQLKTSFNKST